MCACRCAWMRAVGSLSLVGRLTYSISSGLKDSNTDFQSQRGRTVGLFVQTQVIIPDFICRNWISLPISPLRPKVRWDVCPPHEVQVAWWLHIPRACMRVSVGRQVS